MQLFYKKENIAQALYSATEHVVLVSSGGSFRGEVQFVNCNDYVYIYFT